MKEFVKKYINTLIALSSILEEEEEEEEEGGGGVLVYEVPQEN